MNPFIDPEFLALIPPLTPEEYSGLEKSLIEEGCRDALVIWEGTIIDGHNRYEICQREEIPFKVLEKSFESRLDVKIWIRENQASRRNLTDDQRAMNAVGLLELMTEKALHERARAGREAGGRATPEQTEKRLSATASDKRSESKPPKKDTRKAVSKVAKVSERKLKKAKKIKKADPALAKKVEQGILSLSDADKELSRREKEKIKNNTPPPSGKYRVFYCDPPWKYTSGDQHTKEEQDTVIGTHYQSLTIKEICAINIKSMAEKDAVLFLWVTSPLLEECFEVIKAWGFKYKASFVWDKDAHNVGHYNSVRHEFLLICTRGSCKPDNPKLYPSIQKFKRTKHSVKPKEFMNIIDDIYPEGSRIELFARTKNEGWDVWGTEEL